MSSVHDYNNRTAPIDKIEFTLYGGDDILKNSVLDKTGPGLVAAEYNTEKGRLLDSRMGVTSNELHCGTCGLSTLYCTGHFGHLVLAEKMYNIPLFDTVIMILRCICVNCSKLLIYKNENELMEILKTKKGKHRLGEIKKMIKSVKYCSKDHYGCGHPVPKIKTEKKKTTIEIKILAEYMLGNDEENKDKITTEVLSAGKVYDILDNISYQDSMIIGIDKTKSNPRDLIHRIFPIAPVPIRPSVKADFMSSTTKEDHITIKIADILKANKRVEKYNDMANEEKFHQNNIGYLLYHLATYYDNESLKLPQSEQKGGMVTKSMSNRLKGKEGRLRSSLMAKRTDFNARSVITPDPTLSINELGCPLDIAMNLTFPERVTPQNIERLTKLVKNGKYKYPGANFINIYDSQKETNIMKDLRFIDANYELQYGNIVERHLQNGDIILFNRQPTLHKLSMLGLRCKIINNPSYCTFRINPNITTPLNADFDGDEMNGFLPQSIETAMEVQYIADLSLNIITPRTSTPIIAQKQDQLLGAYNMTANKYRYNWRTLMNLLSSTEGALDYKIEKNKDYHGRDMFSYILPDKVNISFKQDGNRPEIRIKNGIITNGQLANGSLGEDKDEGIVQIIWDQYGPVKTKTFIDNSTKLINNFNLFHGMSVGIGDLIIDTDNYNKLQLIFEQKKLEVEYEITKTENNPDLSQDTLLEEILKSKLDVLRDTSSKLLRGVLPKDNNFFTMFDSGSKGKDIQLAQMAGCVGQQDYHEGRIPKSYNGRTLPYFFQNDDRAIARGFIQNSYLSGLDLEEFIFNHMTAREGLIDQAVRSVTGDTKILIIENNKPKVIEIGTLVNNYLEKANNDDIEKEYKNNFELLKVKNIQIPTLDDVGNVTWGDVTAVTRHDPGQQLFEIVTEGGRKVIIPESKSLLIWNSVTKKFEPKLTPEVVIGDFVPVTMNLPAPEVINKFVDMTEYFSKNDYIYGTDFLKAKEEMNKAIEKKEHILEEWWKKNNGETFTLPYPNKVMFQRTQVSLNNYNIKQGYIYPYNESKENDLMIEKFELNKINGQFIGLFIADGNVDIKSGYIQITTSDEGCLKFAEDYFNSMNISNKRNTRVTDIGTINDIRGYSRLLGQFLDSFVGHEIYEKHIPEIAYTAPKEFIIGLIDGFISGDGCISNSEISVSSCSENLIDGLNMILNRFGIFSKKYCKIYKNNEEIKANYNSYEISIKEQWAKRFTTIIKTLINGDKNNKLINLEPYKKTHSNYEKQKDVVLDKIKEINEIDVSKYKKLYDLTIPSTNNFIIYCGLGTYDTADSGYVQRKLIKSTEDYMVGYDGTVRNAVGRICQFVYGDSGSDTTKQFKHIFHIMDKGDKDIAIEFKLTKDEMKNVTNFTEKDNDNYYQLMLNVRQHLRSTQMKASMDRIILNKRYMLPVNLKRIIINKSNELSNTQVMNDPKYIIEKIDELLLNKNTTLMCLTKEDQENPNAIKNKDDKMAKTAFKFAMYDILAPKKCIFRYKFTKEQLDEIFEEIKTNFNKNIVQAGEMVGIIAAQSLGEPITQLMLNAIHSAGVKGKGGMNIGVDRFKEIFSLSRNIKIPYMVLYFEKEYSKKKDFVYKIASYIKLTKIRDIRTSIEIYYDPNPLTENGFSKKDNISNIFGKNANKLSNEYDLTWLLRIKFDKEKMLNREITLIDIKSQLLNTWTNFLKDKKNIEKDKKVILDKISQIAILSNTDNDDTPVIHIRFDMQNITSLRLIEFMDNYIDKFKLKGMKGIVDIGQRKPIEERVIKFDEDNALIHDNEYVIYTNGINIDDILDIVGVDINKIYCNDIITVFENYGIDAARNVIIREITSVLKNNGSSTNYQHIEIFADMMTNMGTLTSIDRHGLSKLDTDPLSRASFEKTVEQLIQAAVFNEVDNMKSVSSRIMAGLCIKGGTGIFDIAIDTELLENSEYTVDVAQMYKKTFNDIIEDKPQEIYDDVYIPDGDI